MSLSYVKFHIKNVTNRLKMLKFLKEETKMNFVEAKRFLDENETFTVPLEGYGYLDFEIGEPERLLSDCSVYEIEHILSENVVFQIKRSAGDIFEFYGKSYKEDLEKAAAEIRLIVEEGGNNDKICEAIANFSNSHPCMPIG